MKDDDSHKGYQVLEKMFIKNPGTVAFALPLADGTHFHLVIKLGPWGKTDIPLYAHINVPRSTMSPQLQDKMDEWGMLPFGKEWQDYMIKLLGEWSIDPTVKEYNKPFLDRLLKNQATHDFISRFPGFDA